MELNKPESGTEYWYRYEYSTSTPIDEDGYRASSTPTSVECRCYEYQVMKHTPKGVWLKLFGYGETAGYDKRFVRSEGHKKFAHATRKEAYESMLYRLKRMRSIYEARAREADIAIKTLEKKFKPDEVEGELPDYMRFSTIGALF